MTPETNQPTPHETTDSLPFPYNQRPFCAYEPIEKSIESVRVLVVNDLLRDERDLSDLAREEWMLQYLSRGNRGPLSQDGLSELYHELLDLMKREVTRG